MRSKLKMRLSSELDSAEAGDLAVGTCVLVLETRTLDDGTPRAQVADATDPCKPLGWVSTIAKSDGHATLLRPDDLVAPMTRSRGAMASAKPFRAKLGRYSPPPVAAHGLGMHISRAKLKVRADAALHSEPAGEVAPNTRIFVHERQELADGTLRALVSANAPGASLLGWVSI